MGNKFKINRSYLIYFSLLILVILVRLPTLFLPIDNDTGATAYHARLILNGEPLYGTHHPAHHLPGIFYTYAAIFAIFGDRPSSLQLVLMVWVWINAILIFKIGKNISSPFGGILSAIFFVFITSMTNIMGDTAEIELFANLPLTGIIWLGFKIIEKDRDMRSEFLIGVLSAVSILFKPVYFASLIAVTLVMLIAKVKRPSSKKWLNLAGQYAIMFLGFATIMGLVLCYFAAVGLFPRLLLVFHLGTGYVGFNKTPWYYSLLIPLIMILKINLVLVIIGMVSAIRRCIFVPKQKSSSAENFISHIILLLWLLFSFVSAGFSRFAFYHYVILLVPAFSVVAGTEISDFCTRSKQDSRNYGSKLHVIVTGIFIASILGNTIFLSTGYMSGFYKFITGEKRFDEFVTEDTRLGNENITAQKIAKYIKQNSEASDRILNWSDLAQVYYLADRLASVDVIWPLYIPLLGHPERSVNPEPAIIIIGPRLMANQELPAWLISTLATSYNYKFSIDTYQIYKNNDLR